MYQVKAILTEIEAKYPLLNGQAYVNTATGKSTNTLPYVPKKVVIYMTGGSSFVDYELIVQEFQSKLDFVFGADFISNPEEFITQLRS